MTETSAEDLEIQETEWQSRQLLMRVIGERVDAMRDLTPFEADLAYQWVKEQCADPRLAQDFRRRILSQARGFTCEATMRATAAAMAEASHLAADGRMTDCIAKLSEARLLFGKACSLGADDQFRRGTGRLIETIMTKSGLRRPVLVRTKVPEATAFSLQPAEL